MSVNNSAKQNVLFVCSQNRWRSPTAERIFSGYAGITVRSAGTASGAKRKIGAADIEWADVIYVMEEKHQKQLRTQFREYLINRKVKVLDIPDEYRYMDSELIDLLKQSLLNEFRSL